MVTNRSFSLHSKRARTFTASPLNLQICQLSLPRMKRPPIRRLYGYTSVTTEHFFHQAVCDVYLGAEEAYWTPHQIGFIIDSSRVRRHQNRYLHDNRAAAWSRASGSTGMRISPHGNFACTPSTEGTANDRAGA